MLSPYWHDVFERLCEYWEIRIFVAELNEPNRQYKAKDLSRFRFTVSRTRNTMLNMSHFPWKTKYLHLQWGLWSDLRRFKPDVVLVNELGPRAMLAQAYGRAYSIPVVPWICVSKHTERNNSPLRETIRRFLLKNAPSICTNLTEAREYLVDVLGVPAKNIFATPYVVDVKKFSARVAAARNDAIQFRSQLSLHGRVFLYVGQMIERKGLKQFFEAVCHPSVSLERVVFLLVGGEVDTKLRSLLERHQVQWRNIPFVQPEDIHQYYAVADLFFFPSLEDEWGIVLNEAAAAGLPLLASKYAGASADLVRNEFNGRLFDPFDPESVREAVKRAAEMSDVDLKQWGANSFSVVKGIDMDFTISNLHAALLQALNEKRNQ